MKPEELDEFTRAYVECALWSTNDESTPQGGEPLDANYTEDDIAEETLEQMAADCREFQEKFSSEIVKAPRLNGQYSNLAMAGHDFWSTRNGHGVGFWSGDWPIRLGKRMTAASEQCGEVNLYVGHDGKIHAD